MIHRILTVSVYGPAVPVEVNAARVERIRAMSAASLAGQVGGVEVEWVVAVGNDDPLLAERMAAFRSSGLPCRFLTHDPTLPPDQRLEAAELANEDPTAQARYLNRGQLADAWLEVFRRVGQLFAGEVAGTEQLLLTRHDDDDALARDAVARIQAAARAAGPGDRAWVLPAGFLLWREPTQVQPYRHPSSGFMTFQVHRQRRHPFEVSHNRVADVMQLLEVDEEPGWLQHRHESNVSRLDRGRVGQRGRTTYGEPGPVTAAVRERFTVDWRWIG